MLCNKRIRVAVLLIEALSIGLFVAAYFIVGWKHYILVIEMFKALSLIDGSSYKGYILYIYSRVKCIGNLNDGVFTHSVGYNVGTAVEKD